jgi:hypothetical protein
MKLSNSSEHELSPCVRVFIELLLREESENGFEKRADGAGVPECGGGIVRHGQLRVCSRLA